MLVVRVGLRRGAFWILRNALVASITALAVVSAGIAVPAASARTVAPYVSLDFAANGGGDRLDLIARVVTARPRTRCRGGVRLGAHSAALPGLTTGAKGGAQWHWFLGDGAPRRALKIRVSCTFPNKKIRRRAIARTVGPGPFPRRAFREVVKRGSMRKEPWVPQKRFDGSGGGADLYPIGQCTWYVARQRPDLPYFPGVTGDAKNWLHSAEVMKLPTGGQPRPGAVAVFQPGQYGAGYYGHVAYVTAVVGNMITVTEANFQNRPIGSARTLPWAGLRFIYQEVLPPPVTPPPPPPPPVLPPPPPPAPPVFPPRDLSTDADLRIDGAAEDDLTGRAVALAGDVNGDGLSDVLVGTSDVGHNGRDHSGSVYVVFGRALGGLVDLATLGAGGFRIDGAETYDFSGSSLAGAGDVNGDGRGDVIVGAPGGGNTPGKVFVVFGKATNTTVDLAALGTGGFRVDGAAESDTLGGFESPSVSAAGDVNGDGRADVVLGAPRASNNARAGSGSAYVVFGKSDSSPVDLAALGAGGFRIDGSAPGDGAGDSVGAAGDVNADGLSDVIVGAPGRSAGGISKAGAAYVVFGRAYTDTDDLGTCYCYEVDGSAAGDRLGSAVAGAGDVNGDGRPDFVVGAPDASYNVRAYSGSAFVIFGTSGAAAVNVDRLGAGGFRMDGADFGNAAGISVAGAGDVNGDHRPDVIVGASFTDYHGDSSGSAYVVFGKTDGSSVDFAALGPSGLRLDGGAFNDQAGYTVSGGSDVNGDGRADVVVGALRASNNGRSDSGSTYVVYGFDGRLSP